MRSTILTLVAHFLFPIAVRADDDSIKAQLDKAKAVYERDMTEFRGNVREWFARREKTARRRGDKESVDTIKKERFEFEVSDNLPRTGLATLRIRSVRAFKVLESSYEVAIEDYTRTKQDALADAIEGELERFRMGLGPDELGFPSIAGVWKSGPNRITFTQQGGMFVGETSYDLKGHGLVEWKMVGRIAQDGTFKCRLIHTKAPDGFNDQTRTGKYSAEDGTLTGIAVQDGGARNNFKFTYVGKQ